MSRVKIRAAQSVALTALVQCLALSTGSAASFTDISAGLPPVYMSSVAWGDYDGDADLDFLLTGYAAGGHISRVYRNDGGGVFTDINAGLPGVHQGSVAWGDYDNDGDLDILLAGNAGGYISRIYRNDGGLFTDINAGLTGVGSCSAAWGDYDNDGDLDILLTGFAAGGGISRIYRNDNGVFVDINAGLPGVYRSSVAWRDYDNDGDLDILLTGFTDGGQISRIYRNDNGAFVDIGAGLIGVDDSSVAWGDYDNDGDLDILLTGWSSLAGYVGEIYRNDNGVFADIGAGIAGVEVSSAAWGDYDNDGDLDVLLAGTSTRGEVSLVFQNNGGIFSDIGAGLTGVHAGSLAWGDYDNDGDLDILLTGWTVSGSVSAVYANNSPVHNTAPDAPTGLDATLDGSTLSLCWEAASDAQTPPEGLTYNVRVGTTPFGNEIASALSIPLSGYRKTVQRGNAGHRLGWTLHSPLLTGEIDIYWSVQAVDTGFMGSPFAAEWHLQPTGVNSTPLPAAFALRPNVPNPFNPGTRIVYDLPVDSAVRLEIRDATGRLVRHLVTGFMPAGRHTVQWNGLEDSGKRAVSGVYLCRLQAGRFVGVRRLTLIK